jgi:hypothetical protein
MCRTFDAGRSGKNEKNVVIKGEDKNMQTVFRELSNENYENRGTS